MVLRVGYIRENIAAPLLQFAAVDADKTFKLVECPGGTGQILAAFKNDEIDIGIALTDALIAGIANGNKDYRLVGQYSAAPLNWAVVVGKDSSYQDIKDLRRTTIGISRIGSGSQTMAAVMSMQQGWYEGEDKSQVEKFKFQVNNNIDGLIKSVNDGSTSAFLWEWFTTKPFVDQGLVRFIGSVPTLWPAFAIAAYEDGRRAPVEAVREFMASLTTYVQKFQSGLQKAKPVGISINDKPVAVVQEDESRKPSKDDGEANADYIVEHFGYPREDVMEWLATVGYPGDVGLVDLKVVAQTLDVLGQAGVVSRPEAGFEPASFVNGEIARFE